MSTKTDLPWICEDHPDAQIRHTWDRTRSEANWGPYRPRVTISEVDTNHRYECAVCGRELAPPSEEPQEDGWYLPDCGELSAQPSSN